MIKKILLALLTFTLLASAVIVSVENFHQSQNIDELLSQNLDGRLIPHKINYTGKLKNILSSGLHSFEFDTVFNDAAPTPFFEIGHDEKELRGTSFEDYLELTKDKKIVKIWMDIKNVNESNIADMLKRLDYLDNKYGIKDILIFETSSTSPLVGLISNAGYHTSYYLPGVIVKYISQNDTAALQKEALRILEQVKLQNFKAVSFESTLYPFVKSYLEPTISKDIVYHTWDFFRLRRKDELAKMQKEDFYKDERIKTIIYTYYNIKLNRLYSF